jgi:hypothetical protein
MTPEARVARHLRLVARTVRRQERETHGRISEALLSGFAAGFEQGRKHGERIGELRAGELVLRDMQAEVESALERGREQGRREAEVGRSAAESFLALMDKHTANGADGRASEGLDR